MLTRPFTDNNGSKRYLTEIVAESYVALGRNSDSEADLIDNPSFDMRDKEA